MRLVLHNARMHSFAALALVAMLAGCATRPENIRASEYPADAYKGQSCPVLLAEKTGKEGELHALEDSQNAAANTDAIGVFLFAVPVSSLAGGDHETQISVTKGQVDAINLAIRFKGC